MPKLDLLCATIWKMYGEGGGGGVRMTRPGRRRPRVKVFFQSFCITLQLLYMYIPYNICLLINQQCNAVQESKNKEIIQHSLYLLCLYMYGVGVLHCLQIVVCGSVN